MRGRHIDVGQFVRLIEQIQPVRDESYPALAEIADSPDTPNDIRDRILRQSGKLLHVENIEALAGNTANQEALTDAEACAVRFAAISRRNELKILPLLVAIDDPLNPALSALADVENVPRTIRKFLNDHKEALGSIDLSAHLDDEQMLSDNAVRRLREAARRRHLFLTTRIRTFNEIKNAIAAINTVAQLPNLSDRATAQEVRQALHVQAHLGNVSFAGHDNDDEVITAAQANELKRLISERRSLLESRQRNFGLIRDAITALNRPEQDVFDALTAVVNADAADHTAIRRALNQPAVRALLGNVDLTGQEALELKLSNAQAQEIHRLALAKRTELVDGLPDDTQKNALKASFVLSKVTDSEDVKLQILANAADNATAIRTAIYQNIPVASQPAHALHGHLNDETVLTDAAALSLRQQAIKKRSALRRAAIEALIASKVTGNKDQLDGLLQAVGVDAIRQALHQNPNLGNFNIENPAQLTDDDALAIRRAAIDKNNTLIGRKALTDEMVIPAAGTDEHTRLMAHIEQNLATYLYRIVRAEEKRRMFRHTQDSNASVDTENLYRVLVNMRNQLAAYKAHLGSGLGVQANLAAVSQNIDKISALLKKMDEKHNKDITKIGHFSKDSQVVDEGDAEALVQQYLGTQANMLNGSLESNSALKKTERFAAQGFEKKVRVNHLEIQGKNKETAHMVSVQKMVNNSFITELRFDPEKLNLSRDWFACIPNDDVMKWAIAEIENHRIGNPHPERSIEIAGNMPEECVKALGLYCQYKGYSHQNFTKHTIDEMDSGQKEALVERLIKNGDYLVGRHKHLKLGVTAAIAMHNTTESNAVAAMKV